MGAIAREAGVSKGTLYVYFKSKEELFEAIVEEQCRQQAEQIFTFDERGGHRNGAAPRSAIELARFLCRPGGISPLRTVIAIADRMPELGAKFYQSGPATRHRQPEALSREQGRGRRPRSRTTARWRRRSSSTPACRLTFKPMLFNFAGPPADARIAPRRRYGGAHLPRRLSHSLKHHSGLCRTGPSRSLPGFAVFAARALHLVHVRIDPEPDTAHGFSELLAAQRQRGASIKNNLAFARGQREARVSLSNRSQEPSVAATAACQGKSRKAGSS